MRTVWLRPDTGPATGSGHVMRCIALGQAAHELGLSPRFVVSHHSAAQLIDHHGGVVAAVADDSGSRRKVSGMKPGDIAVFDGYSLDRQKLEAARAQGARVVVVDDLSRSHPLADVFVNPSCADTQEVTGDRGHEIRLLGPKFAPIRREFDRFRRERGSQTGRLLISLGTSNLGRQVLPSLIKAAAGLPHIEQIVVTHPRSWVDDAPPKVRFLEGLVEPAPIFDGCDLAIATASTTALELLYMGIPTIAIALTENQMPLVRTLSAVGSITLRPSLSHCDLASALRDRLSSLEDRGTRTALSDIGLTTVDGRGSDRILRAIDTHFPLPDAPS